MKVFYFIIPLFLFQACKTQTSNITSSENTTMQQMENKPNGCPEEGNCSLVIHKNKTLKLQKDDIGALYPQILDGVNTVVEYTYLKEGPEGTADGNYSETIYFEVPAGTENLSKENAALSDVNLLYGKQCFCRGEAGYYPVTNGKLLIEKSGQGIIFDLTFKIEKTSQVLNHISEMVKL